MADATPLANHVLRGAVVQVCHQNISSRKKMITSEPTKLQVRAKTICPTQTCSIGREGICCFPGKYAPIKALKPCLVVFTGDAPLYHVLCRDYFLSHWFRLLSWTNQYFVGIPQRFCCHCSGEIDCTGVMKRHPFAGLKQINIQFA